jgi:hypothetical protein
MTRTSFFALTVFLLSASQTFSQVQEPPNFEVAAEFTTLDRAGYLSHKTEPGFGGRFTYNLNRNFALEAAGYFFPNNCYECPDRGRMAEALGGVKAGKRFRTWGIFAKARPGAVSFSKGRFDLVPTGPGPTFPFRVDFSRLTSFAVDLGGVLEFYPSRRIITRFDAGDTITHFSRRSTNAFQFDATTGGLFLAPFTIPARTTNKFQFVASVGFRFD